MYTLTCEFCGKTYQSKFKTKICPECKNRPCEICGKPFVHDWPYDQHCCSAECRSIWINDPDHKRKAVERRNTTVRERYGVNNVNDLPSVKSKIKLNKSDPEQYARLKEEHKKTKAPLIRKCILCGKEFEAVGSQTTCTDKHYRKCEVCGKEFEIKRASDSRRTCSKECRSKLWHMTSAQRERRCAYCGKLFRSESPTAKYCEGPHYANCSVCGTRFEIDLTSSGEKDWARTCSKECATKQAQQTSLLRYGYISPHQTAKARKLFQKMSIENADARQATCQERYGVDNVAQSAEVRKAISDTTSSEDAIAVPNAESL